MILDDLGSASPIQNSFKEMGCLRLLEQFIALNGTFLDVELGFILHVLRDNPSISEYVLNQHSSQRAQLSTPKTLVRLKDHRLRSIPRPHPRLSTHPQSRDLRLHRHARLQQRYQQ